MKTAEPILRVEDASKRFGGVQALSAVGFDLRPGETLGHYRSQWIRQNHLDKRAHRLCKGGCGPGDLPGPRISPSLAPHKIAGMGMARTFQTVRPFASLPAYKNLVVPLFSKRARRYQSRVPTRRVRRPQPRGPASFSKQSAWPFDRET